MLKIRPFIEGKDEPGYIDIVNRAMNGFSDFTPITPEYEKMAAESPNYNPRGRFIAEWDKEPVGHIFAYVDPFDSSKTGNMEGPYVIPSFRRKHIGSELEQAACQSFRERKIGSIDNWVRSDNIIAQWFLESRGFSMTRTYGRMRRDLDHLPENVSENHDIKITPLGKSETELGLQLDLLNETMKEHHDFRPMTIEELKYYTENREKLGERVFALVAYLDNKPVGLLTYTIDQSEIEHLKKNTSWLYDLGVLKPYRHKGIGKALLLEAMRSLKTLGMEEVKLGVDDTNPQQAKSIYENLGFQIVRKSLIYNKKLN